MLMVRPERIRVLDSETAGAEDLNVVAGTLTDRTYNGLMVRYHVTTKEGREIVASVPSAEAPSHSIGAAVRVAWSVGAGSFVNS